MFAKVHPAEDVKSGNTGSCHDLVRYLEKETGEGQRFFSHTEQDISPERVIMDIDGNKKALGANDAKFFMLSLNPSQSEQMHLIGRKVDDFKELTPQEKKEVFQKLEAFTRSAMDEYALNFGRDNIRGGQDLMYYARVETERSYHPEDEEVKQGIARIGEPKPGLNLHVHVIVSRKSLDGKVKLSPGAKSAGNTWELEGRGTVKRGFSHEGWKVRVQECFNRKFDYQAKEGETYVRPQVSAEIGKITNPELKRILQDEQFTAANQIVAAMREQGYTHQVRKGVHSFSREGEVFQVEHRLLKAFEQPLSDEQLKSITERFDLTKYEANPAGYRENGLQVKDISFSTYVKDEAQKGEKALKEVAYKVVYDEQNHTTVSFATVRQFAYEHQINLVKSEPTAEAVLKKIKNPELKNLLENYRFTSANQIVVAMKEQGYTHKVRKGVHSFSREGEVFQVEHRLLKAFEQPLSDEQLKSITERFDLTKYEANPAGYRENGLQVKDISFSTYVKDEAQKGEKALKEVAYKVVYDEQNHTTVSFATVRQFAYEHQINLVKSEPTAEAVLKKIKNPELKNLLENYRFTSANQIVVAMKEQGYTHKVRKGVHSFSREGERVSIRHKDLKKFADPKLESRHMEGIIERFNLYKYKQEGVAYRENSLEAKNISFLTYQKVQIEPEEDKSVTGKPETKEEAQQPQQETPGSEAHPEETENEAETPMPEPDPVKYRKELKEVSYDVLFDRETKTYVPISAIRKYAYENEINLIDRYKHGYAVRNEDLRECLANPEYRTVRQINKAMRERGYTIERDEAGNYTYIKGESSFFMERRDLLAFTGYAKDTGGRERERGTHRSADKTVGFIGGKAKQKLINEILGDSFRTERMLVGNVKKAVSLIQNPANIKMMLIKQIGSFLNPFKEL